MPDEIKSIAGDVDKRELYYYLHDLSIFEIAEYDRKENIYKILDKNLSCIKKLFPDIIKKPRQNR